MTNAQHAVIALLDIAILESRPAGTLFVVATPIGNLDDITLRAVDVLKKVAIVAAEDTRRSRVLLAHIGAKPQRILSLHDHNESSRSAQLVALLQQGHDVALVSDAGTPLICDPGFELVREVRARGLRVVPVPGASALTAVLSASPLPVDRFLFEGFLPSRAAARRTRLTEITTASVSVVFFEAARRLRETLHDLIDIVGPDRQILLAKELTKIHERIEFGAVAEVLQRFTDGDFFERGEFVCILRALEAAEGVAAWRPDDVMAVLCAELPPSQAARIGARITGRTRSELYASAMKRQRDE